PPELIAVLERRWLHEPDDWLRGETAVAFSRFDTPAVRRAILQGLRSPRDEIVGDSVYIGTVLGDFFNPKAHPDVYRRCSHLTASRNDRVREVAARALAHRAPELLLPHVERLATDPVPHVRWCCVYAVERTRKAEHLKLLLRALDDADEHVKDRAFTAV